MTEKFNSIEEAFAKAQADGFPGSMEDFTALCQAAAKNAEKMNLDDMDAVAGGSNPLANIVGDNAVGHWLDEHPAWSYTITGVMLLAMGTAAYLLPEADLG